MGMTAGVIGVTAGVAGATTTTSTFTTSGAKKVAKASSVVAGTLAITASAAGSIGTSTTPASSVKEVVQLALSGGATWVSGSAAIASSPVPGTALLTTASFATNTADATFDLGASGSVTTVTSGEVINLTGLHINTSGVAAGTEVTVTATVKTSPGSTVLGMAVSTPVIAYVASANTSNSISRSSQPTIASTGNGHAAGTLTVSLHGTSTTAAHVSKLFLKVAATSSTYVHWGTATVSSTGVTATGAISSTTLTITLGLIATTASATVYVKAITYNTTNAKGTIKVTPTWLWTSTTKLAGTFTPPSVVNAVSAAAVPAGAPTVTVTAVSVPAIGVGMTGTAGNEKVTITGAANANTKGWTAGGSLTLTAARTGTCNATAKFVAFSGTPTVTYTATTSSGASTTPKVKASLVSAAPCTSAGKDNELKITFTNTVTLKHTGSSAGTAIFVISGLKYAAGATDLHGAVTVTTATSTTFSATHPTPTGTPGNADIAYAYVSTTPVTVSPGSYDHAITPVKVVEARGHTVPAGYVCLTLSTGTFNTSASASVKATGGGTVGSTVSYKSTDKTAMFDVTKMSTATHPSTFTVSGLAVNAPAATSATVKVTARDGETATCATTSGNATLVTTAVAATASPNAETVLTTLSKTTQIYGATAAATAVKLLEKSYTATTAHCPGTATTSNNNRPVVIATETHFQDALSAQYLASDLRTGVLLTAYGSLPSVTMQALKIEGVTQVDVVGGPLAVSTAVVNQLKALPAYKCGGTSELKTNGHTQLISVTRIYGQTAEGTAKAIDSLVPSTHVASEAFVTAYAGVNANKGTGMYNTTGGLSSAPTTATRVPTAILASGAEFQDAMAASTLSYWRKAGHSLPIVLTSPTSLTATAAGALATTGAKQVILMGGTLAVANSVVTTLESDGIEVLRIAGKNYTGTAAELAKFEYGSATHKGLGWTSHKDAVARGNGFTDGLVGAVVAGNTVPNYYLTTTAPEPLLLTLNPTTVGATLTAFLKAYGATGPAATAGKVTSLQIFGGPLAVSPAVISKMETDIS